MKFLFVNIKKGIISTIGFQVQKGMTVEKIISNNFYSEIMERYCQQQVYTLRQSLRTRAMKDKFIFLLFYPAYYNLI